jgi:hypothetical protein
MIVKQCLRSGVLNAHWSERVDNGQEPECRWSSVRHRLILLYSYMQAPNVNRAVAREVQCSDRVAALQRFFRRHRRFGVTTSITLAAFGVVISQKIWLHYALMKLLAHAKAQGNRGAPWVHCATLTRHGERRMVPYMKPVEISCLSQ